MFTELQFKKKIERETRTNLFSLQKKMTYSGDPQNKPTPQHGTCLKTPKAERFI